MSGTSRNQRLWMTRETLEGIPCCPLPAGYTARWYQPGDERLWTAVHEAAEPFLKVTPALFHAKFGEGADLLPERQCYVFGPGEEVVGTGTAWHNDHFEGRRWGRVHWMAVVPAHQGRGIGRALMTLVCQRLRALGYERAYLVTSQGRLAAIALYLAFGFVPLVRNDSEAAAWEETSGVLTKLRRQARSPG